MARRLELAAVEAAENMLTKRQRELLDYLRSFVADYGYPPTVRQICAALNLSSTQTVYAHLARLERKGQVRLGHGHRALQLLDDDGRTDHTATQPPSVRDRAIPLIGRVAAGQPHFAVENVEGYVDLANLRAAEGVFALRVKGDSMIEAGILDGDYLLVRQQETAENGDIVVALLRDEATVKVFYRESGGVRLQPANAKLKPIRTRKVRIIGKVIASLRGYGAVSLISDGE